MESKPSEPTTERLAVHKRWGLLRQGSGSRMAGRVGDGPDVSLLTTRPTTPVPSFPGSSRCSGPVDNISWPLTLPKGSLDLKTLGSRLIAVHARESKEFRP